ncbi:MAG TPA: MBL fold metallo-hydrolase [Gammaproteobacteria bacterium]|nr:MBL fold metallo-hydrolase [Gammaproteobacteria bacterium]
MRFAWLGSGSRGNAALVEADGCCVMIDCGFGLREVETRLARLGRAPADIDAILVTHEHSDHIGGVARFAARHEILVRASAGTTRGFRGELPPRLDRINPHEVFAIGALEITPMPVPHDAREPCQFVLSDGASRLGVVTDLGHVTAHVIASLQGCDALAIEANHDGELLAAGPYPRPLKRRVGGELGHLSNAQAARLLAALDTTRLRHVVALHLSEVNNTPALARAALAAPLGCRPEEIPVADQEAGLDWRTL